ncbi:MAG: prolipoprotein diacylglyceryl transferase [Acidobacteriaceae bacterium]|nr:prolipoprotein diacylglyceryl transferase [Acidobacteriaceae bacterium]
MLPKLISIGSFYIPTYGVLVALGFLAGLSITLRLARETGLPSEKISNLAVYCAMAGMGGGKLFMFLFDLDSYIRNPGQIFTLETLQAAGVFHGGLICALIVAVLYLRKQQLPVFKTMDAFAPGIALGQSIGRLGCFAAGCCWGKECNLPWGVRFRSDFAASVPLNKTLHPVQLYESAADLVIFGLLYRAFARHHTNGNVIALYLVLYSTARFFIEFFREHEQSLVGPFSLTQWIALALLLTGALMLLGSPRALLRIRFARVP